MARRRMSCFLLVALFFAVSLAAQVTWITSTGGTQDWSTGSNWDSGTVPGPNDDVVIQVATTTTITLPTSATVKSLTFGTEYITLLGSGIDTTTLTVTDSFTWTRGILDSFTFNLPLNSLFNGVSGGLNTPSFSSMKFINPTGTTSTFRGDLNKANGGSTWINNGTWVLDGQPYMFGGPTAQVQVFHNGVISYVNGSNTQYGARLADANLVMSSASSIDVCSNCKLTIEDTNSGSGTTPLPIVLDGNITIRQGGWILFGVGLLQIQINPGMSLNSMSGSRVEVQGFPPPLTVSTVTLMSDVTFGTLSLFRVVVKLEGHTLNVQTLTWTAATFQSSTPGAKVVTSVLNLDGNTLSQEGTKLLTDGVEMSVSQGGTWDGEVYLLEKNSTLHVLSTAVISSTSSFSFGDSNWVTQTLGFDASNIGQIQLDGTLKLWVNTTSPGSISYVLCKFIMSSTGKVQVLAPSSNPATIPSNNAPALSFAFGGGQSAGTWDLSAWNDKVTQQITFGGPWTFLSSTSCVGLGTAQLDGDWSYVAQTRPAAEYLQHRKKTFSGDFTWGGGLQVFYNTVLTGNVNMNIGKFYFDGGLLTQTGKTFTFAGGKSTMININPTSDGTVLTNTGLMDYGYGQLSGYQGAFGSSGYIINEVGATWKFNYGWDQGSPAYVGYLHNKGEVQLVSVSNLGALRLINDGTLTIDYPDTTGTTYIAAAFVLHSSSQMQTSVNSDATSSSTGAATLWLNADNIVCQLGGTLKINFVDPALTTLDFSVGKKWTVITYKITSACYGTFTSVTATNLPAGKSLYVEYETPNPSFSQSYRDVNVVVCNTGSCNAPTRSEFAAVTNPKLNCTVDPTLSNCSQTPTTTATTGTPPSSTGTPTPQSTTGTSGTTGPIISSTFVFFVPICLLLLKFN